MFDDDRICFQGSGLGEQRDSCPIYVAGHTVNLRV